VHSKGKFLQEAGTLFSCQAKGGSALNNPKSAEHLKVHGFQHCFQSI
jgi:hypothetical protein